VVARRLRLGAFLRCLALIGAPLPWVDACLAGEPTVGSSYQGREVMLYIALPIGPFTARRSFGLRINQHSLPAALPAATSSAAELSGRRELVDLRMDEHQALSIDFGRHVGWDFSRRQFNLPSDLPVMQAGFPDRTPGRPGNTPTAARATGSMPIAASLASALGFPVTRPMAPAPAPLLRAALP
jgi:hypothetical protein